MTDTQDDQKIYTQFTVPISVKDAKYIASMNVATLKKTFQSGGERATANHVYNLTKKCEEIPNDLAVEHKNNNTSWTQLKGFCERSIKVGGPVSTIYHYGDNEGRLIESDFGIQRMPKKVAAFFLRGRATYIDIVNSGPSIALYLANLYKVRRTNRYGKKVKCVALTSFVADRDAYIKASGKSKKEVISLMFSPYLFDRSDPMVYDLFDDFEAIRDAVYLRANDDFPNIDRRVDCEAGRVVCSFFARIVAVFENKLLQNAIRTIGPANVWALKGDGLIYDSSVSVDMDELCEFMDDAVQWDAQPLESEQDIPEEFDEMAIRSYEEVKEVFEKSNFMIRAPRLYCSIIGGKLEIYSKSDFMNLHASVKYFSTEKNDSVNFFYKWHADEKARTYNRLEFHPYTLEADRQAVDDEVYNTFEPLNLTRLEKCDMVDTSPFWKDYVYDVLADGDKAVYDYMRLYLSWLIVKPGYRTNVSMVLKGRQGCGKDAINRAIGAMYGAGKTICPL